MTTIAPIETHYNGYRFRSRTEARWAIFLDKMGVAYQYEPQGYLLEDGTPYLPDFLVYPGTDHAFWLEIKGQFPNKDEISKAAKLAAGTAMDTYLYFGECVQPGGGLSTITTWNEYFAPASNVDWQWHDRLGWIANGSEAPAWQIGVQPTAFRFDRKMQTPRSGLWWWIECPHCDRVTLKFNGQVGWCPRFGQFGSDAASDLPVENFQPRFAHETPRLQAAYAAARSARFEHGETPAR